MNRLTLALLGCTFSAHAVTIIAGADPNAAIVSGNNDYFGTLSLSGVVMVTTGFGSCSGVLIGDYSVLTAGHCVGSAYGGSMYTNPWVTFLGPTNTGPGTGGLDAITVSSVAINPAYNGDGTLGGDLAVLLLSQAAPSYATRYSLYTGLSLPTGVLVLAGYGQSGTGVTGALGGVYPYGYLRAGTNEYGATGSAFGWSQSLLVGQFYDASTPSTNALSLSSPYSATTEVSIAPGDSGGPTFYNGQVVGIHDLVICETSPSSGLCATPPSEGTGNSSFYGEMWADTSVARNAAFIDGQLAPEPGSAVLLALGLGVALWRKARVCRGGTV
jgi:hypothetical protein